MILRQKGHSLCHIRHEPIGDSGKNMQALAPGAAVAEGKRFPSNVSADELKEWAVKSSQ